MSAADQTCVEAWAAARRAGTLDAIRSFIASHPECAREVEDARLTLEIAGTPTMGGGQGSSQNRFSAVGRILPPAMPLASEGGGYGIILINRAGPRNRQACEAMRRVLTFEVAPVDGRADAVDGIFLYRRPIYWPVTRAPDRVTCETLLRSYDFDRAWSNVPDPDRMAGAGPFVMIIREDREMMALFDFSALPADEFDRQFDAVVKYMSRNPAIWKQAYYKKANLRQQMRKFVGEDLGNVALVVSRLVPIPTASASTVK
ncbi:hypothetical protein [Sphingobium sp.]|uniref:hypothetical protein n=1 Tax=Sphingobium sp. TaxID=1912891 RepID=UPI002B8D3295|nr:hypothetical protein [Sphingobium sp.]HUD93872.1 hypothetical protein [Sphingobium sp.]